MENLVTKTVIGTDDRIPVNELMELDPEKYKKSLAVALIQFPGGRAGTAWRVSSKNLMLTNFHVVEGQELNQAKINFYYAKNNEDNEKVSIKGEKLLIHDRKLDFALFTLDSKAFKTGKIDKFGHLDIDPVGAKIGQEIYIPQFPNNYKNYPCCPKVVSIYTMIDDNKIPATIEAFKKGKPIVYYTADTGPGSSGSPIISASTNKVVAINSSHLNDRNRGINIKPIWKKIKRMMD
ncbi:serine protease [Arsenophonus nasoniae]|uniref:Serine protease n=1 Tax=Arsenophonus nasoniae TaxID=638 RepID=A0A4V1BWE6_9GAMM|nr:serine protease [Arsenophonus nasoniae]QBY41923.1 Trypsin-like peptidase domain protein [Arsenophonus nasoniae]WGM06132.1 serine protease [Arsenophonus nasoniae]WGM11094.1 serine protease [Arsenophonus nasoniae]WGM15796.1 serine protease [Arsenophonus nasoniae]